MSNEYENEKNLEISEIINSFKNSVSNVDDKINSLEEKFNSLHSMITNVSDMTNKVEEEINTSEVVIGSISANASKSNILALNASIEAARSGEHGRGFSVVAKEMGVLAKGSSNSAVEIQNKLKEMHASIGTVVESVKNTDELVNDYNKDIVELKDTVESLLKLAKELEKTL